MLTNLRIAFIGAGNMAEAIMSGVINTATLEPQQIIVTNRSNEQRLLDLHNKYGVQGMVQDRLPIESVDIIVLAMKPKDAEKCLLSLKNRLRPEQVVMSVMAGISTQFMERHLQPGQQVIRIMPNTSSMIQESATAISPGENVTMKNVKIAKNLLKAIGKVYVIEEDEMDLFTGIAGSGPAYFYYLMENIEKIAEENGMDAVKAREIGAQTLLGAAKMILGREESPAQLRENITSKNGTTACGLKALSFHGAGEAIQAAVKEAMHRSEEISHEFENKTVSS
ncbi:pyrroline-5-carboxylate reductase [Salipaludibacillus aurantiacus]|uniref:Pyrroline-5-carboxylate reductase n=1 Tax=Salipaludibacillus aurantiacus TaxID=1601833 RepID=A0A1H9NW08_9BACI|nr:pyrroline-5-carboxylate reductase [Salipaludibacillus aurantiacus]SER40098.1 pyrroline-5-carboxylate reductase [Salipaludibacillus aurantiacus]